MTSNTPDLAPGLELLSEHACFGGVQRFYQHASTQIGLPMRFSVYLPPQAAQGPVPALMFLAGLTCTEETFMVKAGAQRMAAELGLALIAPDTSPRGAGVAGETESWDFGVGAGFYLDATQAPWTQNYRMESYLTAELLPLLGLALPVDLARLGVFGHSMGGHGALTLALKHPALFKSVSAFAPISAPTQCPWGEKAFTAYIGPPSIAWEQYDATELVQNRQTDAHLLIDTGRADSFLETQLKPDIFIAACEHSGQALTYRLHDGYGHDYYFIASFMDDHIAHHAKALKG